MNDLDTLFPGVVVPTRLGPTAVKVRPFTFKQFKRVALVLSKYADCVTDGNDIASIAMMLLARGADEDMDEIFGYCVSCNGLPLALDAIMPDDGISILKEVISVNYDFFTKNTLPTLPLKMQSAFQNLRKLGEEPSNDLSPTDTSLVPSTTTP